MSRFRLLIIAAFVALGILSEISVRTDHGFDFFWGERSCNLWLADEINQGKTLYRDVFSNYGPVPAYLYAWLAALFGNRPETFLRMQQAEILMTAALAWILLQRHLKVEAATLFLLVFAGPTLLFSGGRTAHVGLERVMLLTIALAWRPAAFSSYRRIAAVGAIMGAMQAIKFGGGIVAFGAWVMAEACLREISWPQLIRRWMALAFGYASITFLWAIFLFVWLPRPIAIDVLWPSYMRASYAIFIEPGNRWPHWLNLHDFFALQIEPLLALILLAGMVARVLWPTKGRRSNDGEGSGAFLFLGFFFVLGAVIYFKNVWLFYENFWVLILASAWAWNRLPSLPRSLVAFMFFIGAVISVHRLVKPMPTTITHVLTLPTGDRLWATDRETTRIIGVKAAVDKLVSQAQGRNAVFVVGLGSGWHHFMGWPAANRTSVWLIEGFVRPYDEASIIDSLRHTAAVIVFERMPSTDPRTWTSVRTESGLLYPSGLSEKICQAFSQRLGDPILIDDECWVFPVLPESKAGDASGR